MSTSLAVNNNRISRIPETTAEMLEIAGLLAKSGFFTDAKDANAAFAKILCGAEMGIQPFAAMTGIYIVKGKPQLGGTLLAGLVKDHPTYDYEVVQMDDTVVTLNFYDGEKLLGTSEFTIEDARRAGTQNIDKFPRNMLFSRAMSNGVKWFVPNVTNGHTVYADGEIQDAEGVVVESNSLPFESKQQRGRNGHKQQTAQRMKDQDKLALQYAESMPNRLSEAADEPDKLDALEVEVANAHINDIAKRDLLKQIIMHRTEQVESPEQANYVRSRLVGWRELLTEPNCIALMDDLLNQVNGIEVKGMGTIVFINEKGNKRFEWHKGESEADDDEPEDTEATEVTDDDDLPR